MLMDKRDIGSVCTSLCGHTAILLSFVMLKQRCKTNIKKKKNNVKSWKMWITSTDNRCSPSFVTGPCNAFFPIRLFVWFVVVLYIILVCYLMLFYWWHMLATLAFKAERLFVSSAVSWIKRKIKQWSDDAENHCGSGRACVCNREMEHRRKIKTHTWCYSHWINVTNIIEGSICWLEKYLLKEHNFISMSFNDTVMTGHRKLFFPFFSAPSLCCEC